MSRSEANGLYRMQGDGIPFFRVAAFDVYPSLTYGIFGRQGGVSLPPFATLNLGHAVGDEPQAVQENFERACAALGISSGQTTACHLYHSANIATVTRKNQQRVMGWADGLITAEPDIFLVMRFGDCTPLIFFDPVRQAVGLTHAGWRGTMKNAAGATIAALTERLGCRPKNIIAVIGPAIGPCCYEVGQDVIEAAGKSFVDITGLFEENGKPDHAHFDMWAANRRQLIAAGVEHIIESGLCTACHTDLFFSHRAEKGQTGRFGVIIGRQGETSV